MVIMLYIIILETVERCVIKLVSPEPFIYIASLIVIGIGILVGMLGSGRAVKKYLKV